MYDTLAQADGALRSARQRGPALDPLHRELVAALLSSLETLAREKPSAQKHIAVVLKGLQRAAQQEVAA